MRTIQSLISNGTIFGNLPNWGYSVFEDFQRDMLSEEEPFPCILGVEGLKSNQLRFSFIESTSAEKDIETLAQHLKSYLNQYKKIGKNTSFVAFFKPEDISTIETYEEQFWSILRKLKSFDSEPWPEHISENPNDPLWEYCFHNEPIFVVCNTPAHKKRKSRFSSTFMMTFQPRWVFEGMNANTKKGQKVQKIVRDRLEVYDDIPAHPELAWYGDPNTREWKQYFLRDDNDNSVKECPFHSKKKED